MARIRSVKPEFWAHEELSELPATTHLLAAALLNYADDFGYFNANPGLIKGQVVPLRGDIPAEKIPAMLAQMVTAGFLRLGTAPDGKRYGHVVNFLTHQRVDRPTPSRIMELRILWEDDKSPRRILDEDSQADRGGLDPEGKGRELGKEQGTRKGKELGVPAEPLSSEVLDGDYLALPDPLPEPALPEEMRAKIAEVGDKVRSFPAPRLVEEQPAQGAARARPANAVSPAEKLAAVKRVFAHYLSRVGRNPVTYGFTPNRRQKGLLRLDEALGMARGNLPDAEELLMACVDELAASDFHMGRLGPTNRENTKRFCEWEDHLFASREKFEKWLEKAQVGGPQVRGMG